MHACKMGMGVSVMGVRVMGVSHAPTASCGLVRRSRNPSMKYSAIVSPGFRFTHTRSQARSNACHGTKSAWAMHLAELKSKTEWQCNPPGSCERIETVICSSVVWLCVSQTLL